ncbi:peptidylprolyl isomerase [Thalassotalea piscium]|uniref:peptidylprolyl isomerase n=1 Tax=Thalassotalea piscium TaxID=1230533 RepID=A0A7X0NES7_9GAMM|nr:peptidylprolyl isomerase [Thalassotalea piscium]MBB6542075.1 peptidylprolyl isomerase [Thalassotalea piscium]
MKIIKTILVATTLLALTFVGQASEWRALDPENTVLLTLPHGKVVIELAPQFSPNHVKQFIKLTREGHYNGASFYRVIDGFVAQGGPKDGSPLDKATKKLVLEGEFSVDENFTFTQVQTNDMFVEQTGFKEGFALGYNSKEQKAWMLHCPGVIAMARQTGADTATSHFYITIGQATRYLDRLMTVFGRVVYGMEHVQAIRRTEVVEGDTPVDPKYYTRMLSVQVMSDVAPSERINIEVSRTDTETYRNKIADRRTRDNAFFFKKPPPVLDICQTPVKSRRVK